MASTQTTTPSPKEKDVIPLFPTRFPVRVFLMSLCLFFLTGFLPVFAAPAHYQLDISFSQDLQQLNGKAIIQIPAGKGWQFFSNGLTLKKIQLQEEGGEAFPMPLPQGDIISLYPSNKRLTLRIDYSLSVSGTQGDNRISPDAIVLNTNWHPLPTEPMLFSLRAELPPGFKGISESDTLPETKNGLLQTSFSQAVRSIHLAAAPYEIQSVQIRKGLNLSTWFFKEDRDLSPGYLDAAKAYLIRYEQEIGPFPYSHFAVVADRLPSGFGMPTFTLLGQMVLRLPFIKETSLGHEIVHSWFGNSIGVAAGSGNWCEGLTSYLADYRYAADRGKGAAYRKAALVAYQSYVHPKTAIALKDFVSASHRQAMAQAKRSVGYGRSTMLFHQLRTLLGPEHFTQGIRNFASTYQGKAASWQDIQKVFEEVSKKDLQQFFDQQLNRTDSPDLRLQNIRTKTIQDGATISFTMVQNNTQPYSLKVPIRITDMNGSKEYWEDITEAKTKITISLPQLPLSITIDPNSMLFRKLSPAELPPVWSRFLGAEKKLVVITTTEEDTALAPVLQWIKKMGWPVAHDNEVTNQQLAENSILFLGTGGKAFASLHGTQPPVGTGFQLQVRNNPLNGNDVVVFVSSSSSKESQAALPKLRHYSKYSNLSFQAGRIESKEIRSSSSGTSYTLEQLPFGVPSSATKTFDEIVSKLAKNRVIYLGESHDSLPDHLLQLRIIQALHNRGADLAIAMEMFPGSSQEALDEYVLDKKSSMTESEFLRASHWFKVWRYDWRLFRPIFSFLRKNSIPVYGINIERKIVSSVFAAGNTDGLTPEQKKSIAPERDLLVEGYKERLQGVYGFHSQAPKTKKKKISGFIQSQALWDESMAANIAEILTNNPKKSVLVITGSQHSRKDSGIPPRVLRRISVSQTSVINIYGRNAPDNPGLQADWFFFSPPRSLEAKGKIGVILNPEKRKDGTELLRITGLSPAGTAKKAGILKGDIILSINGQPATNMEDVGIVMMDSRAGDTLNVVVQRKDQSGKLQEKKISVTLSNLNKPVGHP